MCQLLVGITGERAFPLLLTSIVWFDKAKNLMQNPLQMDRLILSR